MDVANKTFGVSGKHSGDPIRNGPILKTKHSTNRGGELPLPCPTVGRMILWPNGSTKHADGKRSGFAPGQAPSAYFRPNIRSRASEV